MFIVSAKSTKTGETDTFSGKIYAYSASLNLIADSSTVYRGGSVQLAAKNGDGEDYGSGDVRYTCSVSPSSGNSAVSIDQSGLLTVSGGLDYSTDYTITVKASLTGQSNASDSVDISVPAVSLTYALSEDGAYSKKITVPMRNLTTAEGDNTYTVYYKIIGVEGGAISQIIWKQKANTENTFGGTVAVGDSTITFTKIDQTISGAVYKYDSVYSSLTGTPYIDGTEISASVISVINKEQTTNITINVRADSGDYEPYSYYIPTEATNGYVTLQGTDIEYRVTGYNQSSKRKYWLLEIRESDSGQYKNTKYISYGSNWNVSQ
jgi:hypothetical protein